MKERTLRRRCRRLLKELDIRPPLDVAELCRRVARKRGKPIRLVPYRIPVPGPFGLWIGTPEVDYIVYQQETSKAHQSHIILHELGHILAEHQSDASSDGVLVELSRGMEVDGWGDNYPALAPEVIGRALRRTAYDNDQEREAETVATIILEWASVLDRVAPQESGDEAAQRMGASLSDRLGWL